jgi:hypothetical protein
LARPEFREALFTGRRRRSAAGEDGENRRQGVVPAYFLRSDAQSAMAGDGGLPDWRLRMGFARLSCAAFTDNVIRGDTADF